MELNKRNQFIVENMRLVEKLAKIKIRSLSTSQVCYEDLVAAGCLGLIEATDRYDETKGSFETWASKRISGSMSDYIHELLRWGKWMPEGSKASSIHDLELIYENFDSFEEITQDLPEMGKIVLREYYVDGFTLKEIGDKLGVGKARVSQLLKRYKCMLKDAA